MAKKVQSRQIKVRGIISFPQIFNGQIKTYKDPKTGAEKQVTTYSADLLLSKDQKAELWNGQELAGLDEMYDLLMERGVAEWGADTTKWPKPNYTDLERAGLIAVYGQDQTKWPLFKFQAIRDQAEKEVDGQGNRRTGYVPGNMFITASSTFQPPVVDYPECRPITDPNIFYAGCEVIMALNAYKYEYMGNVGLKFGLVAIQKIGDGTPFGNGKPDPTKIFNKPVATGATGAGAPARKLL